MKLDKISKERERKSSSNDMSMILKLCFMVKCRKIVGFCIPSATQYLKTALVSSPPNDWDAESEETGRGPRGEGAEKGNR